MLFDSSNSVRSNLGQSPRSIGIRLIVDRSRPSWVKLRRRFDDVGERNGGRWDTRFAACVTGARARFYRVNLRQPARAACAVVIPTAACRGEILVYKLWRSLAARLPLSKLIKGGGGGRRVFGQDNFQIAQTFDSLSFPFRK